MNETDNRRRLLLASSSKVHGSAYLEHCEEEVRRLFAPGDRVLFVPYALHDRDRYAAHAAARFAALGLELDSIHRLADPLSAVAEARGIFVGGGNTFRLLTVLYEQGLIEPLRRRVLAGVPYMGTSAGSNVACPTIRTTNDMPILSPPTLDALALVRFQINPHYLDPDPESTHMGETRDTRLAEFLEENDAPVMALREGAMLLVMGSSIRLAGKSGGKLFRRGAEPREILAGTELGPELER